MVRVCYTCSHKTYACALLGIMEPNALITSIRIDYIWTTFIYSLIGAFRNTSPTIDTLLGNLKRHAEISFRKLYIPRVHALQGGYGG